MKLTRFVCAVVLAFVPGLSAIHGQQPASANPPASAAIHLNVMVTDKSGAFVPNLSLQDFTVLDNKKPQPITSFKVVAAKQEPVRVIVVIDAVNTRFAMVAYVRNGVEKSLRSNEGRLAHPVALAVLTDQGAKIDQNFFTEGNQAADTLEHFEIGLREITRTSQWSDNERLQISLTAFHQLAGYASTLPGRKIVLWISEGWPLLSGARIDLDNNQEQAIFNEAVSLSTQMRRANMTLYNLNPAGVGESIGRADYYQAFLNNVSKPSQVQIGNVGLQVLAIQSGGLTIESDSDVSGMISRCLADASSWYEIDYDPPPADKPDEYHHIEVKVNHPGLTVRTRENYYANPTVDLQR